MERVDIYIDILVENPLLAIPIIAAIFAFALVPAQHRLFATLLLLVPWLTVARLPGLGPIQAAAKLASVGAYALVAFAAITHPGPRRDIPAVLWLYIVIAAISIVYILGVEEPMLPIVLRVQWLVITVAAVCVVRTLVVHEDLMRVVDGLTWGCMLALLLPISGLLLFPAESFLKGVNRFQPYGVNSNQLGMLFALATPLIAYMALTTRRVSIKPALLFTLVITIGMALITGSRQTMLAICIVMLPILLTLTKRPVLTIFGMLIAVLGLSWLFTIAETTAMERFATLESTRAQIWAAYFSDVFSGRPLFGLLGTSGEYYEKSIVVGQHPHNAWFFLMYIGGLSIAGPMLFLTILSSVAGWRTWRFRHFLGGDPLLYSVLYMLLIAMYVQGIFNQVVYWPTYTWSFLHVVLASMFICLASEIRDGNAQEALPSTWDEFDEDDEHGEEAESFEDFGDGVRQPAN